MAKLSDVLSAFTADKTMIDKYYGNEELSLFLGDVKPFADVPCSIVFYYDPDVDPNNMLVRSDLETNEGTILYSNRGAAQSFYTACAHLTKLIDEATSEEVKSLLTNFRNPFINQGVEVLKIPRPQYNPSSGDSGKPVSAKIAEEMSKPSASNRLLYQQDELSVNPEVVNGFEDTGALESQNDLPLGDDAYDGETSL